MHRVRTAPQAFGVGISSIVMNITYCLYVDLWTCCFGEHTCGIEPPLLLEAGVLEGLPVGQRDPLDGSQKLGVVRGMGGSWDKGIP